MNELKFQDLLSRIENSPLQIRRYLSNKCWYECSGGSVPKLYTSVERNMIFLYCKKCFREEAVIRELTVKEYFLLKILVDKN